MVSYLAQFHIYNIHIIKHNTVASLFRPNLGARLSNPTRLGTVANDYLQETLVKYVLEANKNDFSQSKTRHYTLCDIKWYPVVRASEKFKRENLTKTHDVARSGITKNRV
jgi:hypothetical protein